MLPQERINSFDFFATRSAFFFTLQFRNQRRFVWARHDFGDTSNTRLSLVFFSWSTFFRWDALKSEVELGVIVTCSASDFGAYLLDFPSIFESNFPWRS